MTIEEKNELYRKLAHAVQTGIAYKMAKDPTDTEPKHLRVGVNMALIDSSALANILLKKGIITQDEYLDSLIELLQKEVDLYTKEIRALYGSDVIVLI